MHANTQDTRTEDFREQLKPVRVSCPLHPADSPVSDYRFRSSLLDLSRHVSAVSFSAGFCSFSKVIGDVICDEVVVVQRGKVFGNITAVSLTVGPQVCFRRLDLFSR